MLEESGSADRWLARTLRLVPIALDKAKSAGCFVARWASISSKLERIPPCLSDLSAHPLFARKALCLEQLHALSLAVSETIELADRCADSSLAVGKLRMQSDLDAAAARLDLFLRDCRLLIKTGDLLGESNLPDSSAGRDVCDLLVRLQIGHCGAKQQAVDGLLEALRDDERSVVAQLGRGSVSALVHLLAAAAPRTREKAAAVVCLLAESGSCESLLMSEGALPPLIRLAESGSPAARENAAASLQRLSASVDTARSIARHGGVRPLIEACRIGDSVSQLAASCTLKNLSAVPELAQSLVDEGVARAMIDVLDSTTASGPKEHAAECLRNLTSSSDDDDSNNNRRLAVVSEGGVRSLVAYLDAPSPQEHTAGALSNLVDHVSADTLISLGVLPRLVHVLKDGSAGARQAAASAIAKIADSSSEMRRLVGAFGCVPPLVALLDAKSSAARGVAARAIASLMACPHNRGEVKKEQKSVPGLVQLLDPSPQNAAANEHAVCCLLRVASSGRCRRRMVSYGAIGYLKKLVETDVPGAKKLLGRLERGSLRNLFSKN